MNLPMGTVISGRYEVVEKLGSGGMAIVYRAKDCKLERFVTVKILRDEFITDEEFKARFKKEARAAASLSHPNIVNVYDVGEDGSIYYIVMEYVHGDTLKKAIQEKAPFDTLTTISVAIQMASALSHAHKNHIVHRDIKPQNILVATDGTIKVTDFGIARAATAATVTTTANALGSVHYFSPEQARGGYVDEKSDIYSLGITMFEMITGRLPFDGETSVSIALKHLNEGLPNIRDCNPHVSRSLEGIIRKATRKKVDERYSSIDLLLADLKRSLTDSKEEYAARAGFADVPLASPAGPEDGQRELEFLSGRRSQKEEIEHPPEQKEIKVEISSPLNQKENLGEIELPERQVSFHKYAKRLGISKDDDGYDDDEEYEEVLNDEYDDDDEYEDEEERLSRRQEKKVIVAAVLTALVIIGVISVFGMKLFMGGEKKPDREQSIEQETGIPAQSLEGLTFAQAQTKMEKLGITVEKTGEEESNIYEEGIVISQSIAEGEQIGADKKIGVVLSKGLASYDMPGVVGLDENEAIKQIKAAGSSEVQIDRQYENDDTIPVGQIISQQPAKNTKINKDSRIILTISRGEEAKNTTVPNVEGDTESVAKKKITDAGLTVGNITAAESTKVEKGHVITQTVSAGQEVVKNTVVGIVISSGSPAQEEPEEKEEENKPDQKPEDQKPEDQKPEDQKPEDNQKPTENNETNEDKKDPDTQIDQNAPIGSEDDTPSVPQSKSYKIYAPIVEEGTESVHIKILQMGEGGSQKTVFDGTKSISEFPFDVVVTGTGQAEIQCYVDGNYQWSENVNFTQGGN